MLIEQAPSQINIGVQQPINLSKTNPEYNEEISFAFIDRLKTRIPLLDEFYLNNKNPDPIGATAARSNRLTYAQHIMYWLMKIDLTAQSDLKSIILMHQVFETEGHFTEMREHWKDNFRTWIGGGLELPQYDMREGNDLWPECKYLGFSKLVRGSK